MYLFSGMWKLMWSVFVIFGAYYFVRALVDYTKPIRSTGKRGAEDNLYNFKSFDGVGWVLSVAFFFDSWLVGIALQRMGNATVRGGIKARAALMTAVYRKTFKLSDLHNEEGGNIVSLVSTDCYKVYEGFQALHNVWTAPLETAAIVALLLSLMEVYGLPALGVVLIVLPMQYYFGYLIAYYKTINISISDARVLRMHEVLLGKWILLVANCTWQHKLTRRFHLVQQSSW
jgi:ATP-binding cassette, subfamily C (CFTR/MRP), member 1